MAGGTAGSAFAGPSRACSAAYCGAVSVAPAGFSGPVTWVNSPLAWSWLVAAASGPGLSQTGALKVKIRLVGFAADLHAGLQPR